MRLIRKFGTLLTLLAALSITTWSTGCGQKTDAKKKAKTPAVKSNSGKGKKTPGGKDTKKKTGSTDNQPSTSQVTIPGTADDDNPDGVGSGTGAGIKLDDLDNN